MGVNADEVAYSNSSSGINADNLQSALDVLASLVGAGTTLSAANVTAASGGNDYALGADVQTQIQQLDDQVKANADAIAGIATPTATDVSVDDAGWTVLNGNTDLQALATAIDTQLAATVNESQPVVDVTVSAATTINNTLLGANGLSTIPTATVIWLRLVHGGSGSHALTWGSGGDGVIVDVGTSSLPTTLGSGEVDDVLMVTFDGGSNWNAIYLLDNSAPVTQGSPPVVGGSPVSYIASTSDDSQGATMTLDLTAFTLQDGDLLLAAPTCPANRTVDTVPAGWNTISDLPAGAGSSTEARLPVYWRRVPNAATEPSSYDWIRSNSAGSDAIGCVQLRNAHSVSPIFNSTPNNGSSSDDPIGEGTSFDVNSDGMLLLFAVNALTSGDAPQYTAPAGMIEAVDDGVVGGGSTQRAMLGIFYESDPGTAVGDKTVDGTDTGNWRTLMVAIDPA